MKLEWLRLKNFRQFADDQTIRFSRDQDRNVTVIHGVNGAGKTGLFMALNWCLYGTFDSDAGELVSKFAIDGARVGSEIEAEVQLAFSHGGQRYTATRVHSVVKEGAGSWRVSGSGTFNLDTMHTDGQTRPVPNPTGVIESILPEAVRAYFFFDGEKIDQVARPSQ